MPKDHFAYKSLTSTLTLPTLGSGGIVSANDEGRAEESVKIQEQCALLFVLAWLRGDIEVSLHFFLSLM